ncbi:PREDICTED: uncharacterized protein LOC106809520 [Priapulus caudatus]|uniref:Uncharacterized protein LOC106809520 n=1 Tax=Priapulus caudatus TaxID=37621 RepID=A0ABM1E7D3_PRICU|nr:PREDICTED: uncharacterized protein LOC106809520 [Priapulus caudatus]
MDRIAIRGLDEFKDEFDGGHSLADAALVCVAGAAVALSNGMCGLTDSGLNSSASTSDSENMSGGGSIGVDDASGRPGVEGCEFGATTEARSDGGECIERSVGKAVVGNNVQDIECSDVSPAVTARKQEDVCHPDCGDLITTVLCEKRDACDLDCGNVVPTVPCVHEEVCDLECGNVVATVPHEQEDVRDLECGNVVATVPHEQEGVRDLECGNVVATVSREQDGVRDLDCGNVVATVPREPECVCDFECGNVVATVPHEQEGVCDFGCGNVVATIQHEQDGVRDLECGKVVATISHEQEGVRDLECGDIACSVPCEEERVLDPDSVNVGFNVPREQGGVCNPDCGDMVPTVTCEQQDVCDSECGSVVPTVHSAQEEAAHLALAVLPVNHLEQDEVSELADSDIVNTCLREQEGQQDKDCNHAEANLKQEDYDNEVSSISADTGRAEYFKILQDVEQMMTKTNVYNLDESALSTQIGSVGASTATFHLDVQVATASSDDPDYIEERQVPIDCVIDRVTGACKDADRHCLLPSNGGGSNEAMDRDEILHSACHPIQIECGVTTEAAHVNDAIKHVDTDFHRDGAEGRSVPVSVTEMYVDEDERVASESRYETRWQPLSVGSTGEQNEVTCENVVAGASEIASTAQTLSTEVATLSEAIAIDSLNVSKTEIVGNAQLGVIGDMGRGTSNPEAPIRNLADSYNDYRGDSIGAGDGDRLDCDTDVNDNAAVKVASEGYMVDNLTQDCHIDRGSQHSAVELRADVVSVSPVEIAYAVKRKLEVVAVEGRHPSSHDDVGEMPVNRGRAYRQLSFRRETEKCRASDHSGDVGKSRRDITDHGEHDAALSHYPSADRQQELACAHKHFIRNTDTDNTSAIPIDHVQPIGQALDIGASADPVISQIRPIWQGSDIGQAYGDRVITPSSNPVGQAPDVDGAQRVGGQRYLTVTNLRRLDAALSLPTSDAPESDCSPNETFASDLDDSNDSETFSSDVARDTDSLTSDDEEEVDEADDELHSGRMMPARCWKSQDSVISTDSIRMMRAMSADTASVRSLADSNTVYRVVITLKQNTEVKDEDESVKKESCSTQTSGRSYAAKMPPPPTEAGKPAPVQRVQLVTSSGTQTSPSPKPRRKQHHYHHHRHNVGQPGGGGEEVDGRPEDGDRHMNGQARSGVHDQHSRHRKASSSSISSVSQTAFSKTEGTDPLVDRQHSSGRSSDSSSLSQSHGSLDSPQRSSDPSRAPHSPHRSDSSRTPHSPHSPRRSDPSRAPLSPQRADSAHTAHSPQWCDVSRTPHSPLRSESLSSRDAVSRGVDVAVAESPRPQRSGVGSARRGSDSGLRALELSIQTVPEDQDIDAVPAPPPPRRAAKEAPMSPSSQSSAQSSRSTPETGAAAPGACSSESSVVKSSLCRHLRVA